MEVFRDSEDEEASGEIMSNGSGDIGMSDNEVSDRPVFE